MTTQDLKQIQLFRQHLTDPVDKLTVVRDLCGIQCQFMANALHSLQIRCNENVTMENLGQGMAKSWKSPASGKFPVKKKSRLQMQQKNYG